MRTTSPGLWSVPWRRPASSAAAVVPGPAEEPVPEAALRQPLRRMVSVRTLGAAPERAVVRVPEAAALPAAVSEQVRVPATPRPAWAGPVQPMEEWNAEWVANAPVAAKPFLQSRNTTGEEWQQSHKPEGMQRDAPGINPDRWGR